MPRKPKDKHGLDLRVGDLTYGYGYPDCPSVIVHEIDYKKKVVTFLEDCGTYHYGNYSKYDGFGRCTQDLIFSNTFRINFKCLRRSFHCRFPRDKDAGSRGKMLRLATPFRNVTTRVA